MRYQFIFIAIQCQKISFFCKIRNPQIKILFQTPYDIESKLLRFENISFIGIQT